MRSRKSPWPGSLIYKLWNASGNEVESLGEGSFHNGGIVIATPSVVVDTSKIQALPPGTYRVVAFEASSPTIKAEVPFVITNRSWVQFVPKENPSVIAGTLVPVVAANQIGDATLTGAMAYTFTVAPPTGLQIFSNQDTFSRRRGLGTPFGFPSANPSTSGPFPPCPRTSSSTASTRQAPTSASRPRPCSGTPPGTAWT